MSIENIKNALSGGADLEKENELLRNEVKMLKEKLDEVKTRKTTSLDDYELKNLHSFLKTEDANELLKNPDIFEYEEGITSFDKNLEKNPKYYRDYQKRFIQNWSVSSQECVILYYGVGSGKTLIAINCAEQFIELNNDAHVYFLLPASLVLNTFKEMYSKGIDPSRKNKKGEYIYYFISYQQMLRSKFDFKENSLLIVDEAHNLRNFYSKKINQKISARKWIETSKYSLVGNALAKKLLTIPFKFLRTIFMTGTLFVNSSEDIEAIISIGYKKSPLLNMEIGTYKNMIDDNDSFKNYYSSLISYYKIPFNAPEFPTKKFKFVKIISDPKTPTYKSKETEKKETEEKETEELEYADNFYFASRNEFNHSKSDYVLKFIRENPNEKTLIYSQFLDVSLKILLNKLTKANIKFGFISGELNQVQKSNVVNEYNTNKINVLIFTLSIKEGISFLETNNIIVLEPYWNWAIMNQILARGIRLTSHKNGKKSIINIYLLLGIVKDTYKTEEKDIGKWIGLAEEIMNNDIETLKYTDKMKKDYSSFFEKKVSTKWGESAREKEIRYLMANPTLQKFFGSRDIAIYNMVFNKQETINVFQKRILDLPSFENGSSDENNDFIKLYNLKILSMENEEGKQLTNKQKITLKKIMYKEFYDKEIEKINAKFKRFSNDVNYKEFRNPDLDDTLTNTNFNITKLKEMLKNNTDIDEIFKEFKIDKTTITSFQANFTPASEVDIIIQQSGIKNDTRQKIMVLEPTAGIGNVIKQLITLPNKKDFIIDCNELHNLFFNIGQITFNEIDNVKWTNINFLDFASKYNYDYVLGNPPFNIRTQIRDNKKGPNGEIIKHDASVYDVNFLAIAYNLLNVGGILTMIISDRYTRDKSSVFENFRKYVEIFKKENLITIVDVKNFKKDQTITKQMTTNFGMVCITLKKQNSNPIVLGFNYSNKKKKTPIAFQEPKPKKEEVKKEEVKKEEVKKEPVFIRRRRD